MIAPPPGLYDPLAAWRGTCRSCKAPILWADTANNERMPIDEKPSQMRGNVILTIVEHPVILTIVEHPTRLVAGVLTEGQAAGARERGERLYVSHFASCPNASGHRRSRSKTRRWRRT